MINRGWVNNAGFINDQQYVRDAASPLLAVVGDSYIQAQMVPYAKTLQGRLADRSRSNYRVYSFAASGAPLSQYLVYARYAVDYWGARALVINVVGNDFDESHTSYKSLPGFWYYSPADNGTLQLELVPLQRGALTGLVQRSALARYTFINLGLNNIASRKNGVRVATGFAGNTSISNDRKRIEASLQVIDTFLEDLKKLPGLSPDRVLFTVDGFCYPEVAQEGAGTYFDRMRRSFINRASDLGFEVIDLDPRFCIAHDEHFEFQMDGQWNENGHRIAYEAAISSRLLSVGR